MMTKKESNKLKWPEKPKLWKYSFQHIIPWFECTSKWSVVRTHGSSDYLELKSGEGIEWKDE